MTHSMFIFCVIRSATALSVIAAVNIRRDTRTAKRLGQEISRPSLKPITLCNMNHRTFARLHSVRMLAIPTDMSVPGERFFFDPMQLNDGLHDDGCIEAASLAGEYLGIGKRDRTRDDFLPRPCVANLPPGLEDTRGSGPRCRSPADFGGSGAQAYSEDAERDAMDSFGAKWCRSDLGTDPLDPLLSDEEAGYRSKSRFKSRVNSPFSNDPFDSRRSHLERAMDFPDRRTLTYCLRFFCSQLGSQHSISLGQWP
jgi:hypothetical protein